MHPHASRLQSYACKPATPCIQTCSPVHIHMCWHCCSATCTHARAHAHAQVLLLLGDTHRAAHEEEELLSMWGPVQLDWYRTDVDGLIVPHATDLLLRDESELEG